MKKYLCVILVFIIVFCASAHAVSGTETTDDTTEEIIETVPDDTADDGEDTARTFMNINIYMFAGSVILLIPCTVIYFVLRSKKKKKNIV